MVINRMFADTATLMGPGFDAPEREIVGVGGRPAFRLLRLDHLIGNALTLAIGYRLFLAVETKGDLLLHVAGRGPAHQRLDDARLLGFIVELPFLGDGGARLTTAFLRVRETVG